MYKGKIERIVSLSEFDILTNEENLKDRNMI
jgi:hypothetical protein